MEPGSPALEPPGKPPGAESLRNLRLCETILHRGVDTDLQIDHLDQDTDYYLLNKEREKHCFKKYVPSRTVFSKYSNNGRLIHRALISSCWMNDGFPLSISLKPKSYSCIKSPLKHKSFVLLTGESEVIQKKSHQETQQSSLKPTRPLSFQLAPCRRPSNRSLANGNQIISSKLKKSWSSLGKAEGTDWK